MAKKTVGIVGAGISGLLACKHALRRGLRPVVFEAEAGIGGVWSHTIQSTKLQTPKFLYQFMDFPWPEEVEEDYPPAEKVMDYLQSYATRFDLLRHVRFASRVTAVEYVGATEDEMGSWELWGASGEAFAGKGRWRLTVEQQSANGSEKFEVDFLILCTGRFSGLPNMPSFPLEKGPEIFRGKVLHSMDYSNMDNSSALELLKGRRTVVVGYSKSAVDIAAECSDANGNSNPCTLIFKETRWVIPDFYAWGVPLAFLYFTPLMELLVRKPGEGPLLSALAISLSPLRWLISKFAESYFKWRMPLRKFRLVPDHSFTEDLSACTTAILPERFFERMEEGSIIPRQSRSFCFYEKGIITDDGELIPADIVILATGFKGKEKIQSIFASPTLQKILVGSTSVAMPLYRDCIHPRIPQLAIIGFCESLSNLYTSEMRCIWLMHFMDGKFRLPPITRMEEDMLEWQEYMKNYCRSNSTIATLHNWYNAQLCKDIGFDPRRKLGFLGWIIPSLPGDYKELSG